MYSLVKYCYRGEMLSAQQFEVAGPAGKFIHRFCIYRGVTRKCDSNPVLHDFVRAEPTRTAFCSTALRLTACAAHVAGQHRRPPPLSSYSGTESLTAPPMDVVFSSFSFFCFLFLNHHSLTLSLLLTRTSSLTGPAISGLRP